MKKNVNASLIIFLAALLVVFNLKQTTAQSKEKKKLVPTVTIPAPPGSKGFGMPSTGNTPAPRRRWVSPSITESRDIVTTKFDSLVMSDPYIFPDKKTHTYYLTSSGGNIYKSKDLKTWTGPYGAFDVTGTWMEGLPFVAAAEIHEVNGKYYYAATWTDRNDLVYVVPRRYNVHRNQTQILVSDNPGGAYKPLNPDPQYEYLSLIGILLMGQSGMKTVFHILFLYMNGLKLLMGLWSMLNSPRI